MRKMKRRLYLEALAIAAAVISPLAAQSPGVPIEPGQPLTQNPAIVKLAEELKDQGKLLSAEKIAELAKAPVRQELALPAPRTQPLAPREVVALARKAFVRVGWFYLCPRCEHWHLNLAGGYAIDDKGAVATCDHCIRPGIEMREGYLIAVDDDEKVYAVSSVIAAQPELDAAIVKVEGGAFTPLPLQDQISPGDTAYLYSEPFGHLGYFSSGMVNRFYWKTDDKPGEESGEGDPRSVRMNVSTDWAPGSSGAAILDACGNAIGHVSTISPIGNPPEGNRRSGGPTMITLHEAVPARGVKLLLEAEAHKETTPAAAATTTEP